MNESTVECEVLEMQKCQDRLRCLEELTEFTTNCKNQLDELIETLGWTREKAQSQVIFLLASSLLRMWCYIWSQTIFDRIS